MNYSQTQISNFLTLAGLIVLLANQFGWIWDTNQVAFVIGAVWTILSTAYNFIQRFNKGDISILGKRN